MYAVSVISLLAASGEERHGGPSARLTELVGIPDSELATRLRASDETAFSALYHAYYGRLVAVARTFVSRAVAEEITQDVLAHVWERRAVWHVDDGIGVYLYAAVRNRARKSLRHDAVVGRIEHASAAMGESPAMAAGEESVGVKLERADIRSAVDAALAGVSEGARTAFILRWMHELSYAEVARVMETTEATARQQVAKARRVVVPVLEHYARSSE